MHSLLGLLLKTAMSAQAAHRTLASMAAISAVSWPIQFLSATFEYAQGTIIILFPIPLLNHSDTLHMVFHSLKQPYDYTFENHRAIRRE